MTRPGHYQGVTMIDPVTHAAPARPRRRWPLAAGCGVLGVVVGVMIGAVGDTAAVSTPGRAVTAPAAAEAGPADKAAPEPASLIEEGTWVVGEDFPAGTYRTTARVAEGCYWQVSRGGSNGQDILANAIETGGRPRVRLRRGQEFETAGCGAWARA